MSRHLRSILPAVVLAAAATAQGAVNTSLLSQLPGVPCATGGLWGIGSRYVLVGQRSQGWAIIDVADPSNPVLQPIRPPTYPRLGVASYGCGEIKSDGR